MANERLMQLFNIFVGQMNQIGQQRQQRGEFRAGMEMQGRGMQQQQQRFESTMAMEREKFLVGEEQWGKEFKETQRMNKAQMERINAALELMKMERDQEKKVLEAQTIMGAEAGLEGVSEYTTPEQWSEHPGIREAGLSGVVLGMGEGLKGFIPDETAKLREASLIYEAAQFGVPWETLGMDESLKGIYDEGVADKARGIRKDEAQIKAMSRTGGGGGGLGAPPPGDGFTPTDPQGIVNVVTGTKDFAETPEAAKVDVLAQARAQIASVRQQYEGINDKEGYYKYWEDAYGISIAPEGEFRKSDTLFENQIAVYLLMQAGYSQEEATNIVMGETVTRVPEEPPAGVGLTAYEAAKGMTPR